MLSPEDPTASEMQPPQPNAPLAEPELFAPAPESFHWLRWTFLGDEGLRAGWSVLIFAILYFLFVDALGFALSRLHLIHGKDGSTAFGTILNELVGFLPMLGVAALIALIERRRSLLAYNLTGPRRAPHFFSGLAAGFLALSALVGALAWGGWLRIGPVALSGTAIFKYAGLWAVAFLLVGCTEEGLFRCYLQFTLTRGINFWWALGTVACFAVLSWFNPRSNGSGRRLCHRAAGVASLLHAAFEKDPT